MHDNKNIKKDLTEENTQRNLKLTEFDVCELFIKCVQIYSDTASRLEMERSIPLRLGKELWKETLETLKEYRKDNR